MTILLRRGSPEEIQAVMGHEMGPLRPASIYKDTLFFGVGRHDRVCLLHGHEWCLAAFVEKNGESISR